jgi:3-methyladenine DNA glycosylase/8-oxoguanine DNA glycosylase
MKLKKCHEIEIQPNAPFDFDSTFHKPDHFTTGDNFWEPGSRWQTWWWQGKQLGLRFQNKGKVDAPQLNITVYSTGEVENYWINSLIEEAKYRYNLGLDLSGFYQALGDDAVLGPIINRWRGMRPGHPSSLYEYLIIGIVLQNATVRRSMQMFQALLEKYGTLLEYDHRQLWCFWAPGGLYDVSEDELRSLKVGYRAKFIKRIDDYFAQDMIDEMELR